jgi:hypothetical protein
MSVAIVVSLFVTGTGIVRVARSPAGNKSAPIVCLATGLQPGPDFERKPDPA